MSLRAYSLHTKSIVRCSILKNVTQKPREPPVRSRQPSFLGLGTAIRQSCAVCQVVFIFKGRKHFLAQEKMGKDDGRCCERWALERAVKPVMNMLIIFVSGVASSSFFFIGRRKELMQRSLTEFESIWYVFYALFVFFNIYTVTR